eukprot:scaffold3061_cov430-Prasinococcus_capsulatus_cf.AAC.4
MQNLAVELVSPATKLANSTVRTARTSQKAPYLIAVGSGHAQDYGHWALYARPSEAAPPLAAFTKAGGRRRSIRRVAAQVFMNAGSRATSPLVARTQSYGHGSASTFPAAPGPSQRASGALAPGTYDTTYASSNGARCKRRRPRGGGAPFPVTTFLPRLPPPAPGEHYSRIMWNAGPRGAAS